MITTSKYEENGFADIISGLIKVYDPKVAVELGTQQGASAAIIGRALNQGKLYTYDLFGERYLAPPYACTHASKEIAKQYIHDCGLDDKVEIHDGDAFAVASMGGFGAVRVLHIDLCNHYDNVKILLEQWRYKVTKCIILEGGTYNKWQREKGFKPFYPLLYRHFITDLYHVAIIKKNEDYALTILTRKDNDTNVQSEDGPDSLQSSCRCTGLRNGGGRATGSGTDGRLKEIPMCGQHPITE